MTGSTPAMGTPVPLFPRGKLGHYELFERFAVGAMAELYLGRARGEEGFEKLVVIKRVLPRLAEDARFMQMLQIEARIHASLSHKNIVQIHDLGLSAEGEYFIVLEYVDGRDLGTLARALHAQLRAPAATRRIDDALALYIMGEVAEGVHFAHELRGGDGNPLGLVHRDISPSNILLVLRRRGEAVRLRRGQAAQRQLGGAVAQGRARLHLARAGARRAHRSAQRHLLAGRGGLRAASPAVPCAPCPARPTTTSRPPPASWPRPCASGRTSRRPSSGCSRARSRRIRAIASPMRASSSTPAARRSAPSSGRAAVRRPSSRACSSRSCPPAPSRSASCPRSSSA